MERSEGKPVAKRSFDPEDLRRRLRLYDRTPFLEVLALFMEGMPSEKAIQEFADKYPDRWATAIASISNVAGFTQKTETTHTHNINVAKMSDSQIEDELRKRMRSIAIEGTALEVQGGAKSPGPVFPDDSDAVRPIRTLADARAEGAAVPRKNWSGTSESGTPTGVREAPNNPRKGVERGPNK